MRDGRRWHFGGDGLLVRMGLAASLALLPLALSAATTTVTLQRGLDGYDGVADTLLYATGSVADVNYGAEPTLIAGMNQWNERRVVLMRFDLRQIPREAEVAAATLWLRGAWRQTPMDYLTLDVAAVAPANVDWSEGSGDGTRTPTPGGACWNYRRHDTARWAGEPGLSKEGVDYLMPLLGSGRAEAVKWGWVQIPLRREIVQRWLDAPDSNAGMRIYPLRTGDPWNDIVFASSDALPDVSGRPKLVLQIEMDERDAETLRRQRARAGLAAAEGALEQVGARVSEAGSPPRAARRVAALRGAVERLRDEASVRPFATDAALDEWRARVERISQRISGVLPRLTVARAAQANERRGLSTDFALGVADSMTNVLREPGRFNGEFPDVAEVELARNEFEAVQVVIVPVDADLVGATWSLSELRSPGGSVIGADDVSVAAMGYARSRKPAIQTDVEWWPAPILDFMKQANVKRGEVQPLWVCVHAREDAPPGVYEGAIRIEAPNTQPKTIGLRVRVFDFAIPREQHLPTVWGNNEAVSKRLYADRWNQDVAVAMFDFLVRHRLSVNDLYAAQACGQRVFHEEPEGWIALPSLSDPRELKRLWDAGCRWWQIGSFDPSLADEVKMPLDEFMPVYIRMMQASLRVADAAGWPHSNLAIYLMDETRDLETLNRCASQLKAAFPDIALMTTGFDSSYGVKGGPVDKSMDIWCPLTPRYADEEETIREGRKVGKRAWWYVCCGPAGPRDLNFFIQFPAIRSRLLMGAAAWRYQPDGFLYWCVSGWGQYPKPIDSGPLTEWVPHYEPDGDGELICPGPDGPLTTLQFENIRDGIEDYEYYWLLRDLVSRGRERGVDVAREEALLAVPGDLLKSLTDYSEDPARLRAQRRGLAGAIVDLERQLAAADK